MQYITRKNLGVNLLFITALEGTFILFLLSKSALKYYQSLIIPLALVSLGILCVSESRKCDRILTVSWILILHIGMTLQTLSAPKTYHSRLLILLLSGAAAVMIPFLYSKIKGQIFRNPLRFYHMCNVLSAVLYLILLIFGRAVQGTKAWLMVGGISLQLTEVTKLLAAAAIAVIVCDKTLYSVSKRYLLALACTAGHGVFLLAVNELGTLLLIGIAFAVMVFLSLPGKYTCINVAMFLGLAVLGILTLVGIQKMSHGTPPSSVLGKAAAIAQKLDTRWKVFLNPQTDPYGAGYQACTAANAVKISGLFGAGKLSDGIKVPVADSDYAFVTLLTHMGLVFGILTLLLYLLLLLRGIETAIAAEGYERNLIAVFTILIFAQAMIMTAAATGFFVVTGIGTPFLSTGGSSAVCLSACMGWTMLCSSSADKNLVGADREGRRQRWEEV